MLLIRVGTFWRVLGMGGIFATLTDRVLAEAGLRVLDRGYMNTACMESNITFIDGKNGYIQYRDHSIEHLFNHHDYEEVVSVFAGGSMNSHAYNELQYTDCIERDRFIS